MGRALNYQRPETRKGGKMKSFLIFVGIAACVISSNFSVLAADAETPAAENPSEESSSKSGEKPDVTPDAEGFYPNAIIDDPDGCVNLRKEKRADAPIIAKVKRRRAVRV
jgi:hypothetical protein